MKIGGRIIFLGEAGLSEDLILTIITEIAMAAAITDEIIIIIFIIPLLARSLILYTILQKHKKNQFEKRTRLRSRYPAYGLQHFRCFKRFNDKVFSA